MTRVALCVLCLLLCAATAQGQRTLDLQLLESPAGPTITTSIARPNVEPSGSVHLGVAAHHARELLERVVPCGGGTTLDSSCVIGDRDGRTPVVDDRFEAEVLAAVVLYRLRFGLAMPMTISRVADDLSQPQRLQSKTAPGDLRLSMAWPLVVATDVALGSRAVVSLPTGSDDAITGGSLAYAHELILGVELGPVALGARVGYRARPLERTPVLVQDDELLYAIGAVLGIAGANLDFGAEARGRVVVADGDPGAGRTPLEGELSARWWATPNTSVALYGGGALAPGDDAYAAPDFRVGAALRHAFIASTESARDSGDADADRDGLVEGDLCPYLAEDVDGFHDEDGCPDLDDDADGLPDADDRCPRETEDRDGFQDDDGCADPDNDGDGLVDGWDRCPNRAAGDASIPGRPGCPS